MKNRFFDSTIGTEKPCEKLKAVIAKAAISESTSLCYSVKLITPLFGGGTEAGVVDTAMPFRAKSIRGHLRFWWRLLAHEGVFGELPKYDSIDKVSDRYKRWERELWGGVSGNDVHASLVGVQIKDVHQTSLVNSETFGAKYALFSAREIPAKESTDAIPAKKLMPTANRKPTFEMVISFKAETDLKAVDQVKKTIEYWATFGGIGARTRRGLGSLHVKLKNCTVCIPLVTELNEPNEAGISSGLRVVRGATATDADSCWKSSVGHLADFRQKRVLARETSHDADGNVKPGRSFWPEPDVIRKATGQSLNRPGRTHAPREYFGLSNYDFFPRALYGLPIIMEFNKRDRGTNYNCDPATQTIYPVEPNKSFRMASPLIVKACAQSDGKYYAIAVLLPSSKTLVGKLKVGIVNDKTVTAWTTEMSVELEKGNAGNAFEPLKSNQKGVLNATNPLEAFMNYFYTNTR